MRSNMLAFYRLEGVSVQTNDRSGRWTARGSGVYGALAGREVRKGVILTPCTFSRDAIELARQVGESINLAAHALRGPGLRLTRGESAVF